MVGIFCADQLSRALFHNNGLYELLSLSTDGTWLKMMFQSVTYLFLHADFGHIFCNGLVLYFIGKLIEDRYGSKRLLSVFIISGIFGAATWLLLHYNNPHMVLLGASAGCLGVFSYFCWSCENRPLTFLLFFVLPVTLKPRLLLAICAGLEGFFFLTQELGQGGIANSAHLGGMLGGSLCYFCFLYRRQLTEAIKKKITFRSKSMNAMHGESYKLYITSYSAQRSEIDRILDKINATGFKSLTEVERKTLNSAKHLIRQ